MIMKIRRIIWRIRFITENIILIIQMIILIRSLKIQSFWESIISKNFQNQVLTKQLKRKFFTKQKTSQTQSKAYLKTPTFFKTKWTQFEN